MTTGLKSRNKIILTLNSQEVRASFKIKVVLYFVLKRMPVTFFTCVARSGIIEWKYENEFAPIRPAGMNPSDPIFQEVVKHSNKPAMMFVTAASLAFPRDLE